MAAIAVQEPHINYQALQLQYSTSNLQYIVAVQGPHTDDFVIAVQGLHIIIRIHGYNSSTRTSS